MYGSEAHIWLVDVDDEDAVDPAAGFLPEAELARLGAKLQPHRRRGICAHAALRILAAAATTGTTPLPELVRGWNGKPVLEAWGHLDTGQPAHSVPRPTGPGTAPRPLQVSLSHSGAVAAIALSTAGLIGVDVELLHDLPDRDRLAGSTLSDFEHRQWRELPEEQRGAALFRAWTRKEAVLKALGTGLGGGLRSVSAPLAPAGTAPVALRTLSPEAGAPAEWSVHDLPGRPGYVAAVAVHAAHVTVHQHELRIGELLRLARPAAEQVSCAPVNLRREGRGDARDRRSVAVGSRG